MTKDQPKLLSGGNPQIAKGHGDGPVQAYIAAMPGWKSGLGAEIDAIVSREVPGVRKAVKWNTPLYGVDDGLDEQKHWFMGVHCFTQYVKVTFFQGGSLDPLPPGTSKMATVRAYDIREGAFDAGRFAEWVRQASKLPGEKM